MATEQRTQEEIAASVKTMAKLLERQVGNTAELKLQEKEKKELLKQEKLLQDRYEEHLNDEKKTLAEEKVNVKGIRGFLNVEVKKYFNQTETNQVTWGGLGKAITQGTKDWFTAASKQRTMLGRTLRLGASLWEATHKHIIQNVQKLWGAVTGQINEVLGELGGVLGWLKDSFVSVFKFIGTSFMGFFKRVPPADRKRNRFLQELVGYARREEKRSLLRPGEKKGIDWGLLGGLAMVAAGVLGAFLGKILLPFQMIAKAMNLKGIFTAIGKFFMRFKFIGKAVDWLKDMFKPVLKIFKTAGKASSLFKGMLGMFKWGFTKLAWPIQIVMSIFDFIEGWRATEGNIADKFIAGMKNAFLKFIELPVKLIGWIVEKTLGLFGVKTEGVADKIMGWISKVIDMFLGWFRPIIGFFEGFFGTEGSFIDRLKAGIGGFFNGISDFFEGIKGVFGGLMEKLGILPWFEKAQAFFKLLADNVGPLFEIFVDKIKKLLGVFKPLVDKISGLIGSVTDFFGGDDEKGDEEGGKTSSVWKPWTWGDKKEEPPPPATAPPDSPGVKHVARAEAKKKKEEQDNQTEKLTKALDDNTKKQIEADKKIAEEQAGATAIAMGGNAQSGPAETPANPLQDEIEIFGSLAGNNNF